MNLLKADQFSSAMGGLNYIQFNPDDTVDVQPVNCFEQTLNAFQKRTLVFYTGRGAVYPQYWLSNIKI